MRDFHYYFVDADGNSSLEEAVQEEDFEVQLSTSYDFKLNSVHFAKIQAIRTMKNNKKHARLFEAMGIPIEVDKSSRSKKIIISKQKRGRTATSEARTGISLESVFISH